jgi:hypothetical protein
MKDLLEIAQIVTPRKLRAVELFSTSGEKADSMIQQLYDLLQQESVADDDSAAEQLYGKDKSHSGYQKLRGTLKSRLLNSLFLIDLKRSGYKDRQNAYFEAYREWAAAKILLGKQAHTAALSIMLKLLKISRKFEFTELLIDLLHTLRVYYGTIEGDPKKYKAYNEEYKATQQRWIEESLAEELYLSLSVEFVNEKATKRELQKQAVESYLSVKPALEKYDSYQLHLCGRLLEVSQFTVVNNYEQALEVCERAIQFFEAKPYSATVPLQVFSYQRLVCYLQLQQPEPAFEAAVHCKNYVTEGDFNWFKVQEVLTLLNMHSQNYEAAAEVITNVTAHRNLGRQPQNVQESWRIAEAYLYFLQEAGVLSREWVRDFRPARFFNEIEVFSKDKKGMNIPILFLEILLKTISKDRMELVDRVEALDKYRSRYLKNQAELRRSELFMRLLLLLPKNAFDKAVVMEKAGEELQQLNNLPLELARQPFEIEIIPYEVLWEVLLARL